MQNDFWNIYWLREEFIVRWFDKQAIGIATIANGIFFI